MAERTEVNICSLEYDEGQPRVRVWGWFPAADAFNARTMEGHIRYLRGVLRHTRIWIDRHHQPATALPRAMDYLTFAEQRQIAEYQRQQRIRYDEARAMECTVNAKIARAFIAGVEIWRQAETHASEGEVHPIIGIHVAGPIDGEDQRCAHCGALLRCRHSYQRPAWVASGAFYQPGTRVEVGRQWQAGRFDNAAPTCIAEKELPF